jgi:hypothetical protein
MPDQEPRFSFLSEYKTPKCDQCGWPMVLTEVKPYAAEDGWCEDWTFKCVCGRTVMETKKLQPKS